MKKTAMSIVAALGFLLSATVANAQTTKADIPFAFHVANQVLPAGQYGISNRNAAPSTIIVRGTENKQALAALVSVMQTKQTPEATVLVFRRYGDQYFLAQILVKGRATGLELVKTKTERRLVNQMRDHLARNIEPELVTIVAGQ